jgi:hypothetical protein
MRKSNLPYKFNQVIELFCCAYNHIDDAKVRKAAQTKKFFPHFQ